MASHAHDIPAGPIETPPPHTDAYMDMAARRAMWDGFGKNVQWQSMILILVLGYAIFTIAIGLNWMAAMIGFAAFGILAGLAMGMGGAWVATVIGLCVLGLVVQLFITLGHALAA